MSEGQTFAVGLVALVGGCALGVTAFYMDRRKVLRVLLMGMGVAGYWVGRTLLLGLAGNP